MKKFWRKTNRGLWLGAVLLLALVIFIVASEVRFNVFEKQTIQQNTMAFTKSLFRVNLAEEAGDGETHLSAAEHQKQILNEAIQTYWYSGTAELSSRYYGAEKLMNLLEKRQQVFSGRITAIQTDTAEYEMDIQRQSPGRAVATLYLAGLKVTGTGPAPKDSTVLFPLEMGGMNPIEEETGGQTWSLECSFTIFLQMERHGGQWLIAGMSVTEGYGYYYASGLLGLLE